MALTKEVVLDKMKGRDVIVLNVLSAADYHKLHIRGSWNLPYAADPVGFAGKVEKLFGKEKFFITHCSGVTCSAGPNAAKALRKEGFKADDYPGGLQDWVDAGFPVEGTLAHSKNAA